MPYLFLKRPLILSWVVVLLFSFLVSSPKVFAAASTVSISPNQGSAGILVTGSGSNWTATHMIQVLWEDQSTNLGQTTVDASGNFTVSFTIPSTATQGNHTIYFVDATGNLGYFITQTFTVTSTPPPNPTPPPTPNVDLQTLDIHSLQPLLAGSNPTLRADIRNNGSAASGNFNIRWIADGNIADGGHFTIPAGAVDTHDYIWHNITAGQHTITFIANFDHGITETDYSNNQFTFPFTVKTATPKIIPGGMWVTKDSNYFKGGIYKIVVRGYPTNVGDPQISHVNVTGYWGGKWHILCNIPNDRPDLKDYYYCLTSFYIGGSFPADGAITLSFDVYDTAGNVNYAPNGVYTAVFSAQVKPTPTPKKLQVVIDQSSGQASRNNLVTTIKGILNGVGGTVTCGVFAGKLILSVVGVDIPPPYGPITIPAPMPGPTTCAILLNLIQK